MSLNHKSQNEMNTYDNPKVNISLASLKMDEKETEYDPFELYTTELQVQESMDISQLNRLLSKVDQNASKDIVQIQISTSRLRTRHAENQQEKDEFEQLMDLEHVLSSHGFSVNSSADNPDDEDNGIHQKMYIEELIQKYLIRTNFTLKPTPISDTLQNSSKVWNAQNIRFLQEAQRLDESTKEELHSLHDGVIHPRMIVPISATMALISGPLLVSILGPMSLFVGLMLQFKVYAIVSTALQEDNIQDVLRELARGTIRETVLYMSGMIVQRIIHNPTQFWDTVSSSVPISSSAPPSWISEKFNFAAFDTLGSIVPPVILDNLKAGITKMYSMKEYLPNDPTFDPITKTNWRNYNITNSVVNYSAYMSGRITARVIGKAFQFSFEKLNVVATGIGVDAGLGNVFRRSKRQLRRDKERQRAHELYKQSQKIMKEIDMLRGNLNPIMGAYNHTKNFIVHHTVKFQKNHPILASMLMLVTAGLLTEYMMRIGFGFTPFETTTEHAANLRKVIKNGNVATANFFTATERQLKDGFLQVPQNEEFTVLDNSNDYRWRIDYQNRTGYIDVYNIHNPTNTNGLAGLAWDYLDTVPVLSTLKMPIDYYTTQMFTVDKTSLVQFIEFNTVLPFIRKHVNQVLPIQKTLMELLNRTLIQYHPEKAARIKSKISFQFLYNGIFKKVVYWLSGISLQVLQEDIIRGGIRSTRQLYNTTPWGSMWNDLSSNGMNPLPQLQLYAEHLRSQLSSLGSVPTPDTDPELEQVYNLGRKAVDGRDLTEEEKLNQVKSLQGFLSKGDIYAQTLLKTKNELETALRDLSSLPENQQNVLWKENTKFLQEQLVLVEKHATAATQLHGLLRTIPTSILENGNPEQIFKTLREAGGTVEDIQRIQDIHAQASALLNIRSNIAVQNFENVRVLKSVQNQAQDLLNSLQQQAEPLVAATDSLNNLQAHIHNKIRETTDFVNSLNPKDNAVSEQLHTLESEFIKNLKTQLQTVQEANNRANQASITLLEGQSTIQNSRNVLDHNVENILDHSESMPSNFNVLLNSVPNLEPIKNDQQTLQEEIQTITANAALVNTQVQEVFVSHNDKLRTILNDQIENFHKNIHILQTEAHQRSFMVKDAGSQFPKIVGSKVDGQLISELNTQSESLYEHIQVLENLQEQLHSVQDQMSTQSEKTSDLSDIASHTQYMQKNIHNVLHSAKTKSFAIQDLLAKEKDTMASLLQSSVEEKIKTIQLSKKTLKNAQQELDQHLDKNSLSHDIKKFEKLQSNAKKYSNKLNSLENLFTHLRKDSASTTMDYASLLNLPNQHQSFEKLIGTVDKIVDEIQTEVNADLNAYKASVLAESESQRTQTQKLIQSLSEIQGKHLKYLNFLEKQKYQHYGSKFFTDITMDDMKVRQTLDFQIQTVKNNLKNLDEKLTDLSTRMNNLQERNTLLVNAKNLKQAQQLSESIKPLDARTLNNLSEQLENQLTSLQTKYSAISQFTYDLFTNTQGQNIINSDQQDTVVQDNPNTVQQDTTTASKVEAKKETASHKEASKEQQNVKKFQWMNKSETRFEAMGHYQALNEILKTVQVVKLQDVLKIPPEIMNENNDGLKSIEKLTSHEVELLKNSYQNFLDKLTQGDKQLRNLMDKCFTSPDPSVQAACMKSPIETVNQEINEKRQNLGINGLISILTSSNFISYFFSGTENIGTWGQQNAAIRPENIDMSKLANVGNMGKIFQPQSNRAVQANQEYEHLIRVSNTVRDRTQEASSFDQSLKTASNIVSGLGDDLKSMQTSIKDMYTTFQHQFRQSKESKSSNTDRDKFHMGEAALEMIKAGKVDLFYTLFSNMQTKAESIYNQATLNTFMETFRSVKPSVQAAVAMLGPNGKLLSLILDQVHTESSLPRNVLYRQIHTILSSSDYDNKNRVDSFNVNMMTGAQDFELDIKRKGISGDYSNYGTQLRLTPKLLNPYYKNMFLYGREKANNLELLKHNKLQDGSLSINDKGEIFITSGDVCSVDPTDPSCVGLFDIFTNNHMFGMVDGSFDQ